MMMTPEERIVAALKGRDVDRIPTLSLLLDPNIITQVQGRTAADLLPAAHSPVGRWFVHRFRKQLNRWIDPALFALLDTGARINYQLGFDAFMPGYWRMGIRNGRQLQDSFGRVFDIVDDGYGNPYFMYNQGLLKTPEDWRRWTLPEVNEYARGAEWVFRRLHRKWKGKIALVPLVGPGIWENSWQPMGLSEFVVAMRRDPGFVSEVVRYYTSLSVALVEAFCRAGAPAVCLGDDLSYKSGPMLSPDTLDRIYGDGYREITAAAHRMNRPIFLHSCGNSGQLLDLFQDWGFDGAHAFEPTANNDMGEARKKVGKEFCLIGNIDITHVLTQATREEVDRAVRETVEKASGGGFILAPAHTHADINVQNVLWMLEAARRFGP
jgi:uroporphyrinogen decarboxylase